MDAAELVTRAMKATGDQSLRAFAARLGVSHAAVHHWMQGNNAPSFEVAAEMAELAGLPVVKTAADVRLHSKDGAKHRALLRRLAAAAAIAFAALPVMNLWAQQDSNLQPRDYESPALTVEL